MFKAVIRAILLEKKNNMATKTETFMRKTQHINHRVKIRNTRTQQRSITDVWNFDGFHHNRACLSLNLIYDQIV